MNDIPVDIVHIILLIGIRKNAKKNFFNRKKNPGFLEFCKYSKHPDMKIWIFFSHDHKASSMRKQNE